MNTRSEKVDDYITALTDGLADLTEVSDRRPLGAPPGEACDRRLAHLRHATGRDRAYG